MGANRITKIDARGAVSVYSEPANRAHGLAWDPKGRLIAAEQGAAGGKPQLGVLAPVRESLADNFEGNPFLFMNDIAADRKGGIYFTDSGSVRVEERLERAATGSRNVLPPSERLADQACHLTGD